MASTSVGPRRVAWALALLLTVILVAATPVAGSARAAAPPDLGSLDPSFGAHGLVSLFPSCARCSVSTMVAQPDGRILVASNDRFTGQVRRLLPDGSPDPSFGVDGIVDQLPFRRTTLWGIRPLDDGRMILAGIGPRRGTVPFDGPAMLTRLMPDGSIDGSFGQSGVASVSPFGGAGGFAGTLRLPGGDLLAYGYASKPSDPDAGRYGVVARFTADGALVTGWGDGGAVTFTRVQYDSYDEPFLSATVQDVVVSPDGGLFVFDSGNAWHVTADGALDTSFGTDGLLQVPRGPALGLPDGGFVIAGSERVPGSRGQITVRRYLPDATLDPSFGTGGLVTFGRPNTGEYPNAAALDAQGNIIVVGGSNGNGLRSTFLVARILSTGQPDITVGIDGFLTTDVFGYLGGLTHVAQLPDGRIAVMGYAFDPVSHHQHRIVAVYGPHDLDDEAPVATITRPVQGTTYGRFSVHGIIGTSVDRLSGVDRTKVALRMHRPDGSCAWMSSDRGWIDRPCRLPLWEIAGSRSSWRWTFRRSLPRSSGSRGRWYTAYAMARDAAGNWQHRSVHGRNRIRFEIGQG